MDDFLLHPPGWDDPNMYKEESAEICQECFPIIQKTFPETLLMKTNATHFYCSASVSEYDCRKCIDCVLDNLKYAQSLEMNVPLTVKELVKDITQKAKDFNNFSSVYLSVNDFLKCFRTLLTEDIWFKLGFLRTLL
ncbi:hypothetical protein KSS87_013294, partial [Heliosperma pusillum]